MRAVRIAALLAAVLAVSPLAAQEAPPQKPTISGTDRRFGLAMLADVKADLKTNYYDATFHGLDIDAVFAEAEQRLKAAATANETVGIIAEVLTRLNDSHTRFFPPDRRTTTKYGWRPMMIGDEPFVVWVDEKSDAAKKGLEVGDRIVAWNRFQPTRQSLWQIRYLYNVIRPQSQQRVIVRKPDGTEKAIDIESKVEVALPETDIREVWNDLIYGEVAPNDEWVTVGDVFVWRFDSFLEPKQMDSVMKKARGAKSLLLDLRGNGGGAVDALRELVTRLFDRDVRIATEITRKGEKAVEAKGRKDAFTGPLVVLVDSRSASASEVTARLVQIEKRGTVIGDRTAGAVMASRTFSHTYGIDTISFFGTSITVADLRMTDGGTLEHVGVTPDEIVLPTAADLAAKRDPALARALAKLGGTMTPEQAGKLFRQ